MKKFNILNSFSIKLIAMITMAFDHLGVVLLSFWNNAPMHEVYIIFRYIGRFAMPLYAFMIVEGVLHTRSYKKYALKLGLLALAISTFLAIAYFVPSLGMQDIASMGNIFIDLLLGSLMIYLLNQKNNYLKPLAVLPLAVSILSFVAKCIEYSSSCMSCGGKLTVYWFPAFLRMQYDWLTLGLMLGYFLSYYGTKLFYKIREENTGISASMMMDTNESRIITNIFALFVTVLFNVFYYLFKYIDRSIVWWNPDIQLFGLVAGLILLFYSGTRGYNKKWFNIFSYLYYPVHIILIYGICYLISLI